jgi:cellulose synthase/poly-beta-1,6-N-acetylglucosamine synthase-like glycosyltransferase
MIFFGIGIVLLILQDALLIHLIRCDFIEYQLLELHEWPSVTIFLPARNEEAYLSNCLESFEKLDYPISKVQFVLGNDRSSDRTCEIMTEWKEGRRNVELVEVEENYFKNKMNGKANALAQMAKIAKGEYFLFTDADCEVCPKWVKSMVSASEKSNADYVTGITGVKQTSFFNKMQHLDWVLTLGMVKAMSDLGYYLTSMGNNMLIKKEAYESIGGYENIPFSLTEDFEIAKTLCQNGFLGIHAVSNDNLILTKGQKNWEDLMHQRKRWLKGAMKLSIHWKIALGFQVLFFPFILIFLKFNGILGLFLWSIKVVVQGVFLLSMESKTQNRVNLKMLLIFEFYYLITSWMTIIYFFLPKKVLWKGRRY